MIKYFKNESSVVKVDTITKDLTFYIIQGNQCIIRKHTNDINGYNFVAITKYNEGKYVDATEEEFIAFKDLCLNKFN